ncbi:MAG: Holliday junction resolvase RuvX [Pseudomonadota bacterium]|nr:Holliday junction resolvase RuvX [Pseudomonadota bacterium]
MHESGAVVLGFDYGGRRIGVAVGQRITGTATALAVLGNGSHGPDWLAVDKLVREWRPAQLLVGLPLTISGEEQSASRAARAFGRALHDRFGLPVHEHDERYSSRAAESAFSQARSRGEARRKDAAMLDAQAARMIVESYLAHLPPIDSIITPDEES